MIESTKHELAAIMDNVRGGSSNSNIAQRKVAHALLTMAKNDIMVVHFVYKGGYDAVTKLITESKDKEVLAICGMTLVSASLRLEYTKALFDRQILTNISCLLELGDVSCWLLCSQTLANLSMNQGLEEIFVMGGSLAIMQTLLALTDRTDIIGYTLCAMCNLAPALVGVDAEQVVRLLMQSAKKLQVTSKLQNALFILEIVLNLTRVFHFCSLLCDDAVMPLLLALMDSHPVETIIAKCSECFVNLSSNRKNRREIANSGVSSQLEKIFAGSPLVRSYALLMIGNMLSSGLFHEKIAKASLINNIFNNMLDPNQPKQFIAVAYCISQLAIVESSARVIVNCGIIPIALKMLRQAPPGASLYLWNLLVNISHQTYFFDDIMKEIDKLLYAFEVEVEGATFLEDISRITYNLTLRSDFASLLSDQLQEKFAEIVRTLFTIAPKPIDSIALTTIINFASCSKVSRKVILGRDLIDILQEAGLKDIYNNLKYASLLNIISNEDNCCIRMLDGGLHKLLVALLNEFSSYIDKPVIKNEVSATIGTATKLDEVDELEVALNLAFKTPVLSVDITETGKELIAATLHNVALKRAALSPGILTSLRSLIKNSKTLRVVHCARCLANISSHPKAKLQLAKEKDIVPILTSIMRNGVEEADRVQHYSAFVVCNVLSLNVERAIMEELIAKKAIVDLVVVTRLRINSLFTKETLAKSLFNLLTRADLREVMVNNQDILSALIELSKVESLELLELAVRAVYNISCQTNLYEEKLFILRVPIILIHRLSNAPTVMGAKSTTPVKLLCGMALANMSFNKVLAGSMLTENVSEAMNTIYGLLSDEATYCACVVFYNLALHSDSKAMADTVAIPLMVQVLAKGTVICIQLAVSAICNLSLLDVFHEQLTAVAVAPMVQLISVPTLSNTVKLEVVQFLYNLIILYPPCRSVAISAEVVAALWKILKANDKESVIMDIGRIVKELCTEAGSDEIHKQLVKDGIMDILLKLSKKEIPLLKLDLSCSIYSLTTGGDTTRVLNWDGVDIMFWLVLYDSLKLYDPIRKNVSRALRNFSSVPDEGRILVKEDKFLSVLKSLATSNDEDVLWQTAGIVYNLMSIEDCKVILLTRGIIGILFEIASSNYTSVRHVCSACLHMVPDEMPDMDDPNVLSLVLCLLDADGDKFIELSERNVNPLPYITPSCEKGSIFEHSGTDFVATWLTLVCDVDTVFSPSLLALPFGKPCSSNAISFLSSSSSAIESTPAKLNGTNFSNFDYEGSSSNRGTYSAGETKSRITTQTPTLLAQPPPPVFGAKVNERDGSASDSSLRYNKVIEPELPENISFPKISNLTPEVPFDTVSAIKKNALNKNKMSKSTSSIQVNKHQNQYRK